ncbi:MAG: cytochrome c [Planctomycetes bacterium]|nr:cytochrome c [Planctomycetota bacterium]
MKRFVLPTIFAVSAFAFAMFAVSPAVFGQGATKKNEGKAEEKKEEGSKTGDAAKSGEAKTGDAKAEEAPKWAAPRNYDDLMKKMRTYNGSLKRTLKNRDAAKLKELAEAMHYYSTKIVETDKDARAKKDDYKKWAKEMTENAQKLIDELGAKKVDWDAAEKARNTANATCESCHKKYKKDD